MIDTEAQELLLDDLRQDILFVNDIVCSVAPSVWSGMPSESDIRTLRDVVLWLNGLENIGVYKGPKGDIVSPIEKFVDHVSEMVRAGKYEDINYGYWIDYTDERVRRFGPPTTT